MAIFAFPRFPFGNDVVVLNAKDFACQKIAVDGQMLSILTTFLKAIELDMMVILLEVILEVILVFVGERWDIGNGPFL